MTALEFIATMAVLCISFLAQDAMLKIGSFLFLMLTAGRIQTLHPEDGKVEFDWHGFARTRFGYIVVVPKIACALGSVFTIITWVVYLTT